MFEMVEEVLASGGIARDDQDPMIVQEISDHFSDLGVKVLDADDLSHRVAATSIYKYITNRKVPFTPGRKR